MLINVFTKESSKLTVCLRRSANTAISSRRLLRLYVPLPSSSSQKAEQVSSRRVLQQGDVGRLCRATGDQSDHVFVGSNVLQHRDLAEEVLHFFFCCVVWWRNRVMSGSGQRPLAGDIRCVFMTKQINKFTDRRNLGHINYSVLTLRGDLR